MTAIPKKDNMCIMEIPINTEVFNTTILNDERLPLQHQQLLEMTTHSNYVTRHQNQVVQLEIEIYKDGSFFNRNTNAFIVKML